MSKTQYEERLTRINDALSLREPDRVPCAPMYLTFPFLWAGYTMAEVNYDTAKAKDAIRKYLNHFQPDMGYAYNIAHCGEMPFYDKAGVKWMQWAGQKDSIVDDRSIFQYQEKDYLKEDEYPELFSDMTGWIMRRYMPRAYKIFESFENYNLNPARIQSFFNA